ncbi:anti-sigma factor antagonist [Streptomyces sp. DT2A-34]|uniref:anti-sigma factor antagonist n=1 Tax=Streptomyces sp. DT2A-34 TaxID=3051182 RepID=UPI00265B97C5|nr:anti-sigma factor antagonist [Streptomyces sp. DT2A-34]MDO0917746.1 anti-sigma factor antagonist [Streptomyces sp. DT2A-34]
MTAIHPDGDRITVKVSGELDLDSSERFRGVLREALSRSVHGVDLDMGGVTFCDCSALNILLTLRQRALEQAKTIALHPVSTEVDRLLDLTGTHALFARPSPDDQGAPAPHVPDTETSEDADYDLRIEVAQLRRAMQTRPTIDLARGILMASFSLSSEEAWTVLVAASQNTNTKLHSLAGDLVTAVKGDALPDAVQEQLSSAVARVNSGAGTTGGEAEGQEPAQAAD